MVFSNTLFSTVTFLRILLPLSLSSWPFSCIACCSFLSSIVKCGDTRLLEALLGLAAKFVAALEKESWGHGSKLNFGDDLMILCLGAVAYASIVHLERLLPSLALRRGGNTVQFEATLLLPLELSPGGRPGSTSGFLYGELPVVSILRARSATCFSDNPRTRAPSK